VPWIAFGVGGAGLLLGGITGAVALSDNSSLKKACPDASNCNGQSSQISSYHTMGLLSTVGFIVAGVGAGTGLVLLLMQPSSAAAPASAPASAPAPVSGLHVTPVIGLGSFGAVGTF
jgi:hypothetical protein